MGVKTCSRRSGKRAVGYLSYRSLKNWMPNIRRKFDDLFVITFGYVMEKLSGLVFITLEYPDIATRAPKLEVWLTEENLQVYLFWKEC